jgi:branched-chain amino acid transport system permease protein
MHPLNLNQVLREAFFASMLALLLTLPMAGLKLEEAPDGLILLTRFDSVILIVVTVFIAKVLWSYLAHYIAQRQTNRSANRITKYIQENSLGVGIAAIVLTIALPWLPFSDRYIIDLATTILIYIMLGWGLNIVVGLAGLLDLGYVAFYAIGAYSYALLAEYGHLTFWQALPLAGVFSALFALLIGFPVLRLRGDYLAIVTLGFAEVVRIILLNWQSFTHGPNGITGIPRPSFFGLPFGREGGGTEPTFHEYFHLEYITEHRLIFLYYLILLLVLFTNWLVLRLRRLPLGRAWEALREDETACRSLGINPTTVKLSAVAIDAIGAPLHTPVTERVKR